MAYSSDLKGTTNTYRAAGQCAEDRLQELSPDELKLVQCYHDQRADSLNILVTGKTGSGKSTLTKSLLGVDLKAALNLGNSLPASDRAVTEHRNEVNGVQLCVWDTPGFQDGTVNQDEYLLEIEEKCSERDLTLYCMKCGGEVRFVSSDENNDVVAMKKLTRQFGVEFWSNAVIVLTFSNWIGKMDDEWEEFSEEKRAKVFESQIKKWEEQIQRVLITDLMIPTQYVNKIPIVPAGHKKPHLPGAKYWWISELWGICASACKNKDAKAALVKMSEPRVKFKEDVNEKQEPNAYATCTII